MNNLLYQLNIRKHLHLEALDNIEIAIELTKQLENKDKKIKELEKEIKDLKGVSNEVNIQG